MTVTVILDCACNEGKAKDLVAYGKSDNGFEAVTKTHKGFQSIYCSIEQADPNRVLIIEQWDTKIDYDAYLKWRLEDGLGEDLAPMLADEIKFTFLDDQMKRIE